jgi:hypothetical protein
MRLLGICFASFSSGAPVDVKMNPDLIFRLRFGRTHVSAVVDYVRSVLHCRVQRRVCKSLIINRQMLHALFICTRYFASGTGAAGLVGAFLWWVVRGLGVRIGVGISSVNRLLRLNPKNMAQFAIGFAFRDSHYIFLPSSERLSFLGSVSAGNL